MQYTASKLAFKKDLEKEGKRLLFGNALNSTSSQPSSIPGQPNSISGQPSSIINGLQNNQEEETAMTVKETLDSFGASAELFRETPARNIAELPETDSD